MKPFLCFMLFFFSVPFLYSQNEYKKSEDSLYLLIKNEKNNDKKINHYTALFEIYNNYDGTKMEQCNNLLLVFSKKINSIKGIGIYYENAAFISFTKDESKKAITLISKAKNIFYKIKDWDNYLFCCSKLGKYLAMDEQYKEADIFLNEALQIALQKKSKYIPKLYAQLASLYNFESNYLKALQYANKAIKYEKNINYKVDIYLTMTMIYQGLKNYDKALEYNELALPYIKSDINKNIGLTNRATILYEMKRYKEALSIALKCEKYFVKNNVVDCYAESFSIISKCYYKLNKYALANTYIDKIFSLSYVRGEGLIYTYTQKSAILLALKELKNAEKFANMSLELLKSDHNFETKIDVYTAKFEIEKRIGDYKSALFYHQKIAEINETNNINNNKNKLNQLQIDFDVTEKNNQIKNLQITQLQKQVEISEKNNYLIYISIALIITLLSTLFYFRNNKLIKKKNLIIENEKLLVKKSLKEKETLLKEIHHRVKNNMQLVMSLLSIQAQDETQNITDFMNVSRSRILSMALIHENLYQSESLSNVNFKTYTENLIQIIKNALNTNHSAIDIQIDLNELYLDVQTAIPLGLIINELVSNAYKYAFPDQRNGVIQIKLIQQNVNSELTISDNGIGIANLENQKKTLGLQLVEELVFQIDGKMNIVNKNGVHYRIRFENPNFKMNQDA